MRLRFGGKRVSLALGILLFALVMLAPSGAFGLTPQQRSMLAAALLMVTWWVGEALPLAATGMLPLALYPLLGILPARDTAASYAHPIIFLFVGGFLIALALQKWNLHQRLAAAVVLRAGTGPRGMFLAFIAVTAFLSMWVSNTATVMMMLPVAMSVMEAYRGEGRHELASALYIGIAYAASIGGLATPIGTAPNAVMLGAYGELFPEAPRISFAQWMSAGAPLAGMLCAALGVYFLLRLRRHLPGIESPPREFFAGRLAALGPMRGGERAVAGVAAATALLWIFRGDIALNGDFVIRGWSSLMPWAKFVDDGTVAMAAALALFAIPVGEGGRLLDWEWAARLPWDVVLLLGGGFALSRGFEATGLDLWLGGRLQGLAALPPFWLLLALTAVMVFMSEIASNTAQATAILPVLAGICRALSLHPLALMMPAAMACSCGFMLPMATPPNAIVFGTGDVRMREMVRAGFWLDCIAVLAITFLFSAVVLPGWGVSLRVPPAWLHSAATLAGPPSG
jgi:sodium-dependent dicarboxylate transporter 2/3/5